MLIYFKVANDREGGNDVTKFKFLKQLSLLTLLVVGPLVMAQEPSVASLTFQAWKDQQVLEAQNQILRASNRVANAKNTKVAQSEGKDSSALPSSRVKKSNDVDLMSIAEKDLKRSQESMQTATALEFEDYINIYLPTLQNEPAALTRLTEKLSKEDLAEIAKRLISRGAGANNAQHCNSVAVEPFPLSSRSKAP